MTTKQIPLEHASVEQLRKFAVESLGIDAAHSLKHPQQIIARIRAAQPDVLAIPVREDEEEDKAAAVKIEGKAMAEKSWEEYPTVRIRIASEQRPGGSEPAWVSVNGRPIFIPRDTECAVRVPYVKVLLEAVEWVYDTDRNGIINPVPRAVPAYPVSILGAMV